MTSSGRALLIVVVVSGGLATFLVQRFVADRRESELPAPPAQTAVAAPAVPTPTTNAAPTPAPTPIALEPPRFDVVRVGARGVVVVAGRAAPGAEVLLLEEGQELARARADARGEFVILPSEPLRPGTRQFTLLARLSGMEIAGPDVVVVVVPGSTPLVAEARSDAEASLRAEQTARSPTQGQTAPEAGSRAETQARLQAEARAAAETSARMRAEAEQRAAAARAAAEAAAQAEAGLQARADEQARARAEAHAEAARREAERAEASRLAAQRAEAEARRAAERLAAEVVRAEAERQEVARRTELAAAATRQATPAPSNPPLVVLLPRNESAPRVLQGQAPAQGLNLDQVDYDDAGGIRFAGRAAPGSTVRVYVNDRHAGDAEADAQGRWALQPQDEVALGRHRLRLDQIASAGAVAARIEVPFQRDRLPGEALTQGRIVVQPGNSLWRLARHSYGRGVLYTVIYEANRELIRDPNRIYPGQIFVLPAGATPEAQPDPQPDPQPAGTPSASSRSR